MVPPVPDAVPPHSVEAEMAVLGAMMIDPQVISEIVGIVRAEDFYKPEHTTIFSRIISLWEQVGPGGEFDYPLMREAMREADELETIGGDAYLVTLAQGVTGGATAPALARTVREKAVLRSLIMSASQVLHKAHKRGVKADHLLDAHQQELMALAERQCRDGAVSAGTIIRLMREEFARHGVMAHGLDTGFHDLDDKTLGLKPGQVIIVAARPSIGKSALALNIAAHVAASQNVPVAFFSLEMTKEELMLRLVASELDIAMRRLQAEDLSVWQQRHFSENVARVEGLPLYIDDQAGLRILDLRAQARRMRLRHKVGLIVVDYLQLVHGRRGKNDTREQEVGSVSQGLKALARELAVPVLAVAQLSRAAEEHNRPMLSHLRESGSIEADADAVFLLHRNLRAQEEDKRNETELIIAKQRNGPLGTVKLVFRPHVVKFESYAPRYDGNKRQDHEPEPKWQEVAPPAPEEPPEQEDPGICPF